MLYYIFPVPRVLEHVPQITEMSTLNFSRNGWFQKYIDFRKNNPLPYSLPSSGVHVLEETGLHNDSEQAIYYFLQPTGLLYGGLVESPFPKLSYPKGRYFDSVDRVYIIFLESLFACLLSDRNFILEGLVEEEDRFAPAVESAITFFLSKPQNEKKRGYSWLKRLSPGKGGNGKLHNFERVLGGLITQGNKFIFRPELFHNGFLFLDLYNCLLWQREQALAPDSAEEILPQLHEKQQRQREVLLQLLVCAAQSKGELDAGDRRLIEHFMKSSRLPGERLEIIRQAMDVPVPLDEVEIQEMPWIIRRYFLELILMTVLVDQKFEQKEMEFITEVGERLNLWESEIQQSLAALEVFLLSNGEKLNFLKDQSLVLSLKSRLQEKGKLAIRKNLDRLVNEIHETKELYSLLIKSTGSTLSKEEKSKVHEQLMDIMKTIPALAIFALPGGGIILPILIKLLPFNLLPSSFED